MCTFRGAVSKQPGYGRIALESDLHCDQEYAGSTPLSQFQALH